MAVSVVARTALATEIVPYLARLGDGLPAPPPDHPPKA